MLAVLSTVLSWWLLVGMAEAANPPGPPPLLPPPPPTPSAPASTSPPTISGIARPAQTLTEAHGVWTSSPTSYSYQWDSCDSSGKVCHAIAGATKPTYTVTDGDLASRIVVQESATNPFGTGGPVSSAPTLPVTTASTTTVSASQSAPVTNEALTLIATVTSSVSAAAPSGAIAFKDHGNTISACAAVSVKPTGQSVTVICQTSFAAETARLSAVFTPAAGSPVTGSTSATDRISVAHDSSSISLDASNTADVGSSTTYTVSVAPPASRPGPIEPSGPVEFFDGGQPIDSCRGQKLVNGGATCTVTYKALGKHSITATYAGDANFAGATSPAHAVRVVRAPVKARGTITSTMQWTFLYTPAYTKVLALVVNGASIHATVLVKCGGRGCPYARHARSVARASPCRAKAKRPCPAHRSIDVRGAFQGHALYPGATITVIISRPGWVAKYYRFAIRARRAPRILISCLSPGRTRPGVGC